MRSPWLGQASLFWSPLSTGIFVVTVVSSIKNLTDHDLLWAVYTVQGLPVSLYDSLWPQV